MKLYLFSLSLLVSTTAFSQSFEKVDNVVTQSSNGSRAVTFIDVDKDGWLDIFITNGPRDGQNNLLYINDGQGSFEQNTSSAITKDNSSSDGATWGDIDNDGFEDLYVVNWYGEKNLYYKNREGTLSLSPAIDTQGYSETASWADFDQDGYLDLYITNSSLNQGGVNEFYINQGDGTFAASADKGITDVIVNSRSVNWIDYDNDNDLDLFVSNEGATNELYNNDQGTFTKLTSGSLFAATANSTGSSWADYDNDGDLDLYVANAGQTNEFFQNQGDGTFSKITGQAPVDGVDYSYGTAWGDIDNDGDLDLYVANGFKTGEALSNRLYLNNGDGTFTADTENTVVKDTGWSFGAAFGDYDNDGFLDLMVAKTFSESQRNNLYHNLGNDNNWLILDLEGTASNRSAIGAKVKVTTTEGANQKVQLREISSQSGYNCQNSMRAHFGLGAATVIDKVEVIWPNGNSEEIVGVEINQITKVKETVQAGFLRADFVLKDAIYLPNTSIEFTNLSVFPEGESVTYEWDFDNDGEIDSTDPSPTMSFSEIGDYTVRLVTKYGDKTDEKIKADYLKVRATLLDVKSAKPTRSVTVFPNPAVDILSIKADFKVSTIQILAIDGRTVFRTGVQNGAPLTLNVKDLNLTNGLYTLMASGNGQQKITKFLIKN